MSTHHCWVDKCNMQVMTNILLAQLQLLLPGNVSLVRKTCNELLYFKLTLFKMNGQTNVFWISAYRLVYIMAHYCPHQVRPDPGSNPWPPDNGQYIKYFNASEMLVSTTEPLGTYMYIANRRTLDFWPPIYWLMCSLIFAEAESSSSIWRQFLQRYCTSHLPQPTQILSSLLILSMSAGMFDRLHIQQMQLLRLLLEW